MPKYSYFRAVIVVIISIITTITIIPMMLLDLLIGFLIPRLKLQKIFMRVIGRLTRFMLFTFAGVDFELRGIDNLPKDKGALLFSKHMSTIETLVLSLVPKVVIILRKSLLYIPIANICLFAIGSIPIKRNGGTKELRKLLKKTQAEIDKNRRVLVFPEGTRVPVGEKRQYHLGLTKLYPATTIIPIATNSGVIFGKSLFSPKRKGKVVVEILPSIESNLSPQDLKKMIVDVIEKNSQILIDNTFQKTLPPKHRF